MGELEEYVDCKNYLMKNSLSTGRNVYDQLTELVRRLLTLRANNSADIIDDVIKSIQRREFKSLDDVMTDKDKEAEKLVETARRYKRLFEKDEETEALEASNLGDAEVESPTPNLQELLGLMHQVDLGLDSVEVTRIGLSLKRLVDQRPGIEAVRFWGKIFGTEKDYLVAEVDYRDGDEEEEEETEMGESTTATAESQITEDVEDAGDSEGEGVEDGAVQPPKPNYKPPPSVPVEASKTGANLKTYFVCNDLGQEWTKLPLVTPAQIFAARLVRKLFTGNLNAELSTYPPFPGVEKNYLRAQLSRISAATHISPVGFYQFDEDEDEEDGEARRSFQLNPEFEGLQVRELADPSVANWAHHVLYIMRQGRTSWWNPKTKEETDEAEDEDEDKEVETGPQPEVGVPLLTPLSEDAELDGVAPWSAKISTKLLPKQAIAVVSSNLWPGAHAFANSKIHENIYIGWGLKFLRNYSPPLPTNFFREFLPGPEIEETEDPLPEQEKALHGADVAAEQELGDGGEHTEGNDDEDDDEDD